LTTTLLNAAVERAKIERLLPLRPQSKLARSGDSGPPLCLVDALSLGSTSAGQAYIAIVQWGGRQIVVPALVIEGELVRDPGIAHILRAGLYGNFEVEVFNGGIPAGSMRELEVDQSNDSVIAAESVMVKWQLDAVVSPASERLRALNGREITPQLHAIVTWKSENGQKRTILTAVEYVKQATDGWTWAVELVRSLALGEAVDPIGPLRTLGEMTANMHSVFAQHGVGQLTAADLAVLHAQSIADLQKAIHVIDGPEGERLRARTDAITDQLDQLRTMDSTPSIDIHGDYHIGQVLRASEGGSDRFAIVDFDGSPALPPTERMLPAPAARDIAGMLASIDHVARVVNFRTEKIDTSIAVDWIPKAQQAFIETYVEALTRSGNLEIFDKRLISPLIINQECREYIYAAESLPHWRYVPDAVLTGMFPKEN
jgi:maltokinase